MSDTRRATSSAHVSGAQGSGKSAKVTPELIRQVADKVYALWRRDLQIEKERAWETRPSNQWRY
jgi:hypothetical protein